MAHVAGSDEHRVASLFGAAPGGLARPLLLSFHDGSPHLRGMLVATLGRIVPTFGLAFENTTLSSFGARSLQLAALLYQGRRRRVRGPHTPTILTIRLANV